MLSADELDLQRKIVALNERLQKENWPEYPDTKYPVCSFSKSTSEDSFLSLLVMSILHLFYSPEDIKKVYELGSFIVENEALPYSQPELINCLENEKLSLLTFSSIKERVMSGKPSCGTLRQVVTHNFS